ncbi:N-acetylneuraminate synthase family protein [Magnetococcus sp. PR-3]|uniref:N-acetylneuraminate synthase family protein n=1 Tax=Magnetococcus sp. PR-3 TaxID=3120355 RepID=UPI002FCE6180
MVQFGSRSVGDGAPCFVTYEAGPTHDGVESAKKLVRMAAEAGADAVKFQILDPDRLVADRKQLFSYQVLVDKETGQLEDVSEPLYDILCRRALNKDEWREIKKACDALDLAFFATAGFEDEVNFLAELGCHSIKIASADVDHFPLIKQAAATGMCLQLDTGNATIGEIEEAIDIIRQTGNEDIIIHHCPSGYPARLESINLNVIPTLKRMFPYPVAYSDHTPGWEMDVAAIAMGANLVEKTITEDRTTRSVEHVFSLEPPEMRRFIEVLREVEIAMGRSRRVMHEEEKEKRKLVRRSICVSNDVAAGTVLTEADLTYRRPGLGISPKELDRVVGTRLAGDKKAGEALAWTDLS